MDDYDDRDPLSHPDLARMSMAELADLPLAPENFGRAAVNCRMITPVSGSEKASTPASSSNISIL